nr:proline-rich proteoglycan 2-like isoform X2 [Taeniopygia guttata]
MCSPAGPASPPQPHGPASASRGGPGRVAEGRSASATPQPSRSRRGPRRPGRAVAMRRTRSQPTPHSPAPPVLSPVPPQIPPRSANLQAGPARRSRCDTRSHRGTHAPPPPDRAPQPATARPGRGGPGRAGWAAWDRGNARLGGERDNAIVGVSFRCFSFSFVSFRFLSFLPPVTGVQRVSRSHLAAVPAGDASSEPVELFRTEGPSGTELRRAAAEPGGLGSATREGHRSRPRTPGSMPSVVEADRW